MAMPFIKDVLPLVLTGMDAGGTVPLFTGAAADDILPELGTELFKALAEFPVLAEANEEAGIFAEADPPAGDTV